MHRLVTALTSHSIWTGEAAGGQDDTYGFALAAHPGKSQGRPSTNTGSKPIERDRPARPRLPQGAPVPDGRTVLTTPDTIGAGAVAGSKATPTAFHTGYQPARARQPRDRPPLRRHRHLPQRRSADPPRRHAAHRTIRRVAHRAPLPLPRITLSRPRPRRSHPQRSDQGGTRPQRRLRHRSPTDDPGLHHESLLDAPELSCRSGPAETSRSHAIRARSTAPGAAIAGDVRRAIPAAIPNPAEQANHFVVVGLRCAAAGTREQGRIRQERPMRIARGFAEAGVRVTGASPRTQAGDPGGDVALSVRHRTTLRTSRCSVSVSGHGSGAVSRRRGNAPLFEWLTHREAVQQGPDEPRPARRSGRTRRSDKGRP